LDFPKNCDATLLALQHQKGDADAGNGLMDGIKKDRKKPLLEQCKALIWKD
jgi:hypothetical protein